VKHHIKIQLCEVGLGEVCVWKERKCHTEEMLLEK
jgi:hypothetical protein